MLLNCDLGESYGSWKMGADELAMPHIDLANIACGFHAGDPMVLQNTLSLAKQNKVTIGAHPSYPDRQGFGRRSMALTQAQLIADLHYQIAAIDGMAKVQGLEVNYVKPHGALYNDMIKDETVRISVFKALQSYPSELKLMILAGTNNDALLAQAKQFNVALIFEAFADRRYTDAGTLTPRTQAGSVLDKTAMLEQVQQLLDSQTVTTDTGRRIHLQADTLCVHGDNEQGINIIKEIRALCQR